MGTVSREGNGPVGAAGRVGSGGAEASDNSILQAIVATNREHEGYPNLELFSMPRDQVPQSTQRLRRQMHGGLWLAFSGSCQDFLDDTCTGAFDQRELLSSNLEMKGLGVETESIEDCGEPIMMGD